MKKEKVVVGGWKGSSLHINVSTSFTSNDVLLGLSSSVPSLTLFSSKFWIDLIVKKRDYQKVFNRNVCTFQRNLKSTEKVQAWFIPNSKEYALFLCLRSRPRLLLTQCCLLIDVRALAMVSCNSNGTLPFGKCTIIA